MSQLQQENELFLNQSSAKEDITAFIQDTLFVKKEVKMNRFDALFNFFKSMLPDNKKNTANESELSQQTIEQRNQAQQFLDTSMYDAYVKMVGYGYQPTTEQKNVFSKHVLDLFDKNNSASQEKIDLYVSHGYQLEKKDVFHYILNIQTHSEEVSKAIDALNFPDKKFNHLYPNLTKEYIRVMAEPDFSTKFLKFCIRLIQEKSSRDNGTELSNIHNALIQLYGKDTDLFLKNISFDETMNFIKFNHDCYKNMSNYIYTKPEFATWAQKEMPRIIESYYKTDLENKLQKTKTTYHGELENLAKKAAQESIRHQGVNVLPKEVKDKINEIEIIYLKLKTAKGNDNPYINAEEDFDIQNIFEKRIPEVLQKYIRIPEEYRQNTRHETTGKTAYEMVMESLDNYQQKLQGILDVKVQNSLSDMNATKIYSQKIR